VELIQILEKLLALEVEFPERAILVKSLTFLANTTLSLEDCYHLAFCKTKGIVKIETFDEKLAKEFGRE